MSTHTPNDDPQDRSNEFDDLADHTDCGIDENYNSDFEAEENNGSKSDLGSEDEAMEAVNRARKAGRCCRKCTQIVETIEAYHQHLKTTDAHFLCQYCDNFKDHRTLKNLRFHWQKHHSSVYCEYCCINFSSATEKREHSNSEHCVCERCMIWFKSQGRRRYHWASSDAHKDTYCKICKLDFADPAAYTIHFSAVHGSEPRERVGNGKDAGNEKPQPSNIGKENATTGSSRKFYKDSNSKDGKNKSRPKKSAGREEKAPPNHYRTLGIPSSSSAEAIARASRQRRIEVHPDRLKRQEGLSPEELEMIDIEAKNVGFAADVLSNEIQRLRYDRTWRLWYYDSPSN